MHAKQYLIVTLILSFVRINSFAQCTEAKDSEMAKYKRLTETQDAQGCSQCAMLALYFCSARHTVKIEDKRKVGAMITACKKNIQQMGQPYCCPEYLNKEPEWGKETNGNANSNSNGASDNTNSSGGSSNSTSAAENKLNNAIALAEKLETSFYSMQEVEKNRNELNELSSLKGKFNSVEEIERSFQEKFNKIASTVDKTVESENTAMMDNVSTMNQLSGGNELIGQGIGLAAGLLNSIGAEERRREYEERLRKQKEEQIRRLKAMKASQVVEVRKALMGTFPDGGLPTSSTTIDNQVIYIFSYSTNQYSFLRDKPNLSVTNVFPITRNKDGTWMFKNVLIKNLKTYFSNDDTPMLLGFFTSEKDANSLRDSFLYLASQCDFNLNFTTYSNATIKETNNSNDNDFWKN
jgi:hypothetical protein